MSAEPVSPATQADSPEWAALGPDEFRATARATLARLVDGNAEQWERDRRLPRELWRELGRQGLLGLGFDRRLGGGGASLEQSVALLTELGRTGFAGLRTAVAVHSYMATRYLGEYADPSLQQAYLAPALTGAKVAALAITEPAAGSDLAALASRAVPDGDGYRLTGCKSWVVNGSYADFAVLVCRTSDQPGNRGLSLLVVDLDLPGVRIEPQRTLGWHSAAIATLTFDDVPVPPGRLIGRAGAGFYLLMYGLQYERLAAAAMAVGGAEFCLQILGEHLRRRTAHGSALAGFQAVRHRVAALATEVAAAGELVARAARGFAGAGLPVTECSMAKVYATEVASRAADACLQLHGAAGYAEDAVAARLVRDARAATIAAGPTEVLYDLIADAVL